MTDEEKFLDKYSRHIRKIALYFYSNFNTINEVSDWVNIASLGLIISYRGSIRKGLDPNKVARKNIKRRMFDELRRLDFVPRRLRIRSKNEPDNEKIQKQYEMMSMHRWHKQKDIHGMDISNSFDASDLVSAKMEQKNIMSRLPIKRDRDMLDMWMKGYMNIEIAEKYKLTGTRVYQIKKNIMNIYMEIQSC